MDRLVGWVQFITLAGIFVVVVLNPKLIVDGIALVTNTISSVLSMGK